MRSSTLLAIPLLWLTGCVTAGDCNALALARYDRALEQRLADELDAAPPAALWPRIVTDYAGLRDQVRACQGTTGQGTTPAAR